MQLLLDEINGTAVASLYSEQPKSFGDPIHGHRLPLEVSIVRRLAKPLTNGRIWQPQEVSGYDWFRAAIGQGNLQALAGDWDITFGADTTAAIVFNPTAQEVEDALNLIASVISAGYVDVVEDEVGNGLFIVTFRVAGAQAEFTFDNSRLAPLMVISGGTLITGSASPAIKCVQTIQLSQNPAAFLEMTTALPAASSSVTVLQVGGGGNNHKVRVSLLNDPYDGNWTFTVGGDETDFIPLSGLDTDGNEAVGPAIGALASVGGVANVSVVKEEDSVWLIMFIGANADTDMGAITVDHSGLLSLPGLTGTLLLNTPAMALLLGGAASIAASFQIEGRVTGEAAPDSLFRKDVTLLDSIINPNSSTPTPTILFYTAAECDALFALLTVATKYRFKADGTFLLYCPDTTLYHPITLVNDPAELQVGTGEA